MRRRLEFLADQVDWLLGDVACLAMMALFLPLVPVFKVQISFFSSRLQLSGEYRQRSARKNAMSSAWVSSAILASFIIFLISSRCPAP